MAISAEFEAHLASGVTTLARAWAVRRRDGRVFGFTDHDRDLSFDGLTFKANTGLTARALQQTTGLSLDNSEALGGLSDAAVTEADIRAGRFDGAEVEAWLVNWAQPAQRLRQFRGRIGEITRAGGAFRAELLGLAEVLNQPQGHVYQTPCSAVLGDRRCRVDLGLPEFSAEVAVVDVVDQKVFRLGGLAPYGAGWFARGRLEVVTGAGAGLVGVIKNDRDGAGGLREVELWESLRAALAPGDRVRVVAGCDKQAETCRLRFDNLLNFRGFPDIPGEDRALSIPVSAAGAARGGAK